MFLLGDDQRLVISASDLRTASACEFALVRDLDVLRGLSEAPPLVDDPMLKRVSALGDEHENAELRRLGQVHRGRVRQLPSPVYTPTGLAEAMAATLEALGSDAEVLSQATLFDGGFVGRADFLERTPEGWLVSDTKLARHENVPALLQIAAYAALLSDAGVEVAPVARLVLGGGDVNDVPLRDVVAVYRTRRARLEELLADHRSDGVPAAWGDGRWLACGRCPVCEVAVEESRDLLLVAGMRGPTRRRLLDAGVRTIEELAAHDGTVLDVRPAMLERLRAQAVLQLAQEAAGGQVQHEVTDVEALRRMPRPSEGDVFFDFEGDPLWRERGSSIWGLEYLFGMVETDSGTPEFRAFWAHDRHEEKQALVAFIDHLAARRRRWPDLHVYHYAPYEPAALLRLSARHGVYEDEVDQLLRENVFVDLYSVVRAGVRVSQRSYSIKKLEPLYMEERQGDVQGGAESIVVYHQFSAARIEGREDEASALIGEIAHYNEDDCISTLKLRDWLLARRAEHVGDDWAPLPVAEVGDVTVSEKRRAALDLEAAVRAWVDDVVIADRTDADHAVALVGSAVLFHAREDKPKWQEHFERLRLPVGDWRSADGVFLVEGAEVVVDWHQDTPRQRPRRTLRLHGEPMRQSGLRAEAKVSAVYGAPPPAGIEAEPLHANARSTAGVTVLETEERLAENGRLHQTLLVEELQSPKGGPHGDAPVALVPNDNVSSAPIDRALAEVAEAVRTTGRVPVGAGTDVLLRQPPRLRDGGGLPQVGTGDDRYVDAVTAALTGMDDSYVAVQGPPGTGKTHVGAHVIARLVAQGWAVGVCAQSHAAVENVLTKIVTSTAVPGEQVGKVARSTTAPRWTALEKADDLAGFAFGHRSAGRGFVIGGTAWDFTNPARVDRRALDLLVVDEAGPVLPRQDPRGVGRGPAAPAPGRPAAAAPGHDRDARRTDRPRRARLAGAWGVGAPPRGRVLPREDLADAPCPHGARVRPRVRRSAALGGDGDGPPHARGSAAGPARQARRPPRQLHPLRGGGRRGARPRPRPPRAPVARPVRATGRWDAGRAAPARAGRRPRHHPLQRAGRPAAPDPRRRRAPRGAGRDRRQVPGAGGSRGDPVDGGVLALRRLARDGLPPRPAPAQRGGLAREALGLRRPLAGPHRLRSPLPRRARRPRRLPRAVRRRRDHPGRRRRRPARGGLT